MATLTVQPSTYSGRKLEDTLFQRVPADMRYTGSRYHSYLPVNSLGSGVVDRITFNLPPFSSATLYDLSSLLVEMTVQIVDQNGNLPHKDVRIANICGAQSFFSDVKYYLNDVLINPNSGLYHYKHYLKTLMSYPKEYKETVLGLEGYSEDTEHHMQSVDEQNEGFVDRLKNFAKLNNYDNVSEYYADGGHFIFNLAPDLQASIINGVSIRIEITPNQPNVCLFGKKVVPRTDDQNQEGVDPGEHSDHHYLGVSGYKFLIKNICLHVLCHDLRGEVYEDIESSLKKQPISLSFRRFDMVPYTISKGVESYISDVLFPSSQMVPSRAFFFLVPSDHFTGTQETNPYDFQLSVLNANVKRFYVTLGGQDIDGLISNQNFNKMAFYRLQKVLGLMEGGFTTGITYKMFSGGYGIYAIDFSTSLASCQQYIMPSIRSGHARCTVEFDRVTPSSYHLLGLFEYPSNITISIGAQGRVVQVCICLYVYKMRRSCVRLIIARETSRL